MIDRRALSHNVFFLLSHSSSAAVHRFLNETKVWKFLTHTHRHAHTCYQCGTNGTFIRGFECAMHFTNVILCHWELCKFRQFAVKSMIPAVPIVKTFFFVQTVWVLLPLTSHRKWFYIFCSSNISVCKGTKTELWTWRPKVRVSHGKTGEVISQIKPRLPLSTAVFGVMVVMFISFFQHSGGLCRWHGYRAQRGFSAPSPLLSPQVLISIYELPHVLSLGHCLRG